LINQILVFIKTRPALLKIYLIQKISTGLQRSYQRHEFSLFFHEPYVTAIVYNLFIPASKSQLAQKDHKSQSKMDQTIPDIRVFSKDALLQLNDVMRLSASC